MEPDGENLWYFKIRLYDPTEFIVWNIQGLRLQVAKIKGLKDSKSQVLSKISVVSENTKTTLPIL